MNLWKKPRLWVSHEGSTTMVLYDPGDRGDHVVGESVFVHGNLGWMGPLEISDRREGETIEKVAEKIAEGYNLQESDREVAISIIDREGQEDLFTK